MTPATFARAFILHWEDGGRTDAIRTHSVDPVDAGNWTGGARGAGVLVGSNHGVTAKALASYRKVPVPSITRAVMHALTLGEAAEIALALYYRAPGLDWLTWNRVTASLFDFGWGAGPASAVKVMQRLVGCPSDGIVGNALVGGFAKFTADEANAASAWGVERNRYYDRIIAANPANARFRNGWRNRTAWFLPDDPGGWWKAWENAK